MKRTLGIIILSLSIFSLSACSNKSVDEGKIINVGDNTESTSNKIAVEVKEDSKDIEIKENNLIQNQEIQGEKKSDASEEDIKSKICGLWVSEDTYYQFNADNKVYVYSGENELISKGVYEADSDLKIIISLSDIIESNTEENEEEKGGYNIEKESENQEESKESRTEELEISFNTESEMSLQSNEKFITMIKISEANKESENQIKTDVVQETD